MSSGTDKKRTSDGDVPLTENGLGSHINRSSSAGTISQTSEKSNPQSFENETPPGQRVSKTGMFRCKPTVM